MIIETKDGNLLLTEIQNVNGSLDNDERLKKQILQGIKESGFDHYKSLYGFVARKDSGGFRMDFTHNKSQERHKGLLEMFEEDKKLAIKFESKLSIFLIK